MFTLGALALGGSVFGIAETLGLVERGNGVPDWLWPILVLIWSPGILGLIVSFYSIARYPRIGRRLVAEPGVITTRSWIWTLLGSLCYLLAPLVALSGLLPGTTFLDRAVCFYVGIELGFTGFLLSNYRRERHPTIATFLRLTLGIGFVLFPIYLPSIVLGSLHGRALPRATRSSDPIDARANRLRRDAR